MIGIVVAVLVVVVLLMVIAYRRAHDKTYQSVSFVDPNLYTVLCHGMWYIECDRCTAL